MRSSRWVAFGVLATAGHVALFSVMPRPGERFAERQEPFPATDVEVELLAPAPAPAPAPASATAPASAPAPAAASGSASASATGSATASASATGAGAGASSEPSSDGWTFNPAGPADVTSRGAIARATRGIGTEGLAEQGAPSVARLNEALDERDSDRGVGRGGPLLAALERAMMAGASPFEGAATFDVGIDTSGHVSVAVLDTSVASSDWSSVAEAAKASVNPSTVRIPPGARGWHVVARVEAQLRYPNGVRPKDLGNRATASPGHITETKEAIVIDGLPNVTLSHAGKVCSVSLTLGLVPGISGGCDPSNIGSQALRTVRGRIVSEGRL